VYDIAHYHPDRTLRGFTLSVNRITRDLKAA